MAWNEVNLYLLYNVTSRIHAGTSFFTKHVCCLLDTKNYNKHRGFVLQMDNARRGKYQLSHGPSTEQQRLWIVTTQSIVRNTTLRKVSSSSKDKEAQGPFLDALKNIRPSFGASLSSTLSSVIHTFTTPRANPQSLYLSIHTDLMVAPKTWAWLHLLMNDVALN